jgi:hypothetical protein
VTPENREMRLTRYLLGRMAPEEQERLEDEYAADPDLHDQLRAIERDLIDRYVRGELQEPEEFEKVFLASPSRRQKVAFARALMRSFAQAPPVAGDVGDRRDDGSWWMWPRRVFRTAPLGWRLAAATMILIVGGWLALNWEGSDVDQLAGRPPISLPPEDPTLEVPSSGVQSGPSAPSVQPSPAPLPPASIATFVLVPTLTRSAADTPTLVVEGSADVRLELHFEAGDYDRYQAVLRTPEGEEVARANELKPAPGSSRDAVVMTVPGSAFNDLDFIVILNGVTGGGEVEEVASYYFRAQRR